MFARSAPVIRTSFRHMCLAKLCRARCRVVGHIGSKANLFPAFPVGFSETDQESPGAGPNEAKRPKNGFGLHSKKAAAMHAYPYASRLNEHAIDVEL